MAQPGPIQTTEQGISNYQILPTTPTTTPITGKQYLYNANDVLSTKDSLNNVQRVNKNYDNYVPNFDMEQGLTPYVFTGVTATLNTTTQLEGLKSINFDAVALNDFIETPLITIPRILMGQTCMVRINIRGGDANLKLSLINGAGTEIAFKQLAVFADSTPQFLTFNCANQAAVTGTPALGQLKIKVTQSTATNSALATLDSFYLGRFESNTMTVSEFPQWYYYTANADINGNFTFPAPTASNGGGLFAYAGTTLTVLKPIKLDINARASGQSGGTSSYSYATINCTISGVLRMVNYQGAGGTSVGSSPSVNGNIILSAGDTCGIIFDRGVNPNTAYSVNITATPLPQLATIVNTNTPRAGWLGQRTWAAATCQWNRSSVTPGTMGAIASCATGVINSGLVVPDAVTDGQLPKVTLSKLPKGKITVKAYGVYGGNTTTSSIIWSFDLALNGTLIPNSRNSGFTGSSAAINTPVGIWTFNNPSDLINANIEIFGSSSNGSSITINGTSAYPWNIVVSYEPDLSDPYSIPELYAALPPQVINSSGKIWRTESCYITNNGTAAMASSSCNTWVQSVSRPGLGYVRVNFIPNIFSSPPDCSATTTGGVWTRMELTPTTAFATIAAQDQNAYYDRPIWAFCQGFTN